MQNSRSVCFCLLFCFALDWGWHRVGKLEDNHTFSVLLGQKQNVNMKGNCKTTQRSWWLELQGWENQINQTNASSRTCSDYKQWTWNGMFYHNFAEWCVHVYRVKWWRKGGAHEWEACWFLMLMARDSGVIQWWFQWIWLSLAICDFRPRPVNVLFILFLYTV